MKDSDTPDTGADPEITLEGGTSINICSWGGGLELLQVVWGSDLGMKVWVPKLKGLFYENVLRGANKFCC